MNNGWRPGNTASIEKTLVFAGLAVTQAHEAAEALAANGLVVLADYYVPTSDELYVQYCMLGEAYLRDQINVRWVMCRETHDALDAQYNQMNYIEMSQFRARAVVERSPRPTGPSMLFGIPVRIDPAARRPMFEIAGSGEDRGLPGVSGH